MRLLIVLLLLAGCSSPPSHYAPYDFWQCADMKVC